MYMHDHAGLQFRQDREVLRENIPLRAYDMRRVDEQQIVALEPIKKRSIHILHALPYDSDTHALEPGGFIGFDADMLTRMALGLRAVTIDRSLRHERRLPASNLNDCSGLFAADHLVEELRVAGLKRGIVVSKIRLPGARLRLRQELILIHQAR